MRTASLLKFDSEEAKCSRILSLETGSVYIISLRVRSSISGRRLWID